MSRSQPADMFLKFLLLGVLISVADAQESSPPSMTFNWYFLILVIAVVVLMLPLIYYARRRKAKALANRHIGHNALSRDVANFSGPRAGEGGPHFLGTRLAVFDPQRWRYGGRENVAAGQEEGLDESGMPPPPYDAGDKPPSISHVHVRTTSVGESSSGREGDHAQHAEHDVNTMNDGAVAVPPRTLSRSNTRLRRDFEALDDDVGDILRPTAAQFGNERRLENGHAAG